MIEPSEFLRIVRPALEAGDAALLAQAVQVRWRPDELCRLLRDGEKDVRRVAAVTLGLIGDMQSVPCLTRALRDEDEQVNQMAEHGLWSIWFRSGDPKAAEPFRDGVALLSTESFDKAITKFHLATQIDPTFAEAYNQCGIAHYFLGQWKAAIADCRRTIRLVPAHFGATAGMGHCYAQYGKLREALRCYRRAMRINPRMTAIADAIERLEVNIQDLDSSGEFLVDQFLN